MEEYAFCSTCNDSVEFSTVEDSASTEIDGVAYSYPVKRAICKTCGNEAAYAPYQKEMGEAFGDAVRRAEGIVELSIVRDFPKKYRIGKRPLSLLLGWGEITYSRFIEGAIPSRAYSDRIVSLYENPDEFIRLLKANKDRISDAAYSKSYEATAKIIEATFPEVGRIYEVAGRFLIRSGNDLTNMALQKLVYYAQGFSLAFFDNPLFEKEPKAWAAGPVYGQLWKEYKHNPEFCEYFTEEDSPFSIEEERLIDAVSFAFRPYSGQILSEFTHSEMPWLEARKRAGVPEGESSSEPILLSDMKTFFKDVVQRYGISDMKYIQLYPRALIENGDISFTNDRMLLF